MKTVTASEAIGIFERLMTPFIETPPSSALEVYCALTQFHRDIRVTKADDSLMLEWGAMTPHLLNGFTDLRTTDFDWDNTKYRLIAVSHQLKSTQEDDDIALRAFIYFGPATSNEPSSNIEYDGLDELEAVLDRFVQVPYVAGLLATKPSRVTAFVGEVG